MTLTDFRSTPEHRSIEEKIEVLTIPVVLHSTLCINVYFRLVVHIIKE